MAAEINMYGLQMDGTEVIFAGPSAPATSGLGFFGSSFGNSVQVGLYQDSTYITNANGTAQGPQVNNLKPTSDDPVTNTSGVEWNGSDVAGMDNLQELPNASGTLNVRFTNDTAVRTQNVKCYIHDRVDKANPPSGVTAYFAELIHPSGEPADMLGSGSAEWVLGSGDGSFLTMASSPGISGTFPSGFDSTDAEDVQHDWYVALTASPNTIGPKTDFGLFFELEYL